MDINSKYYNEKANDFIENTFNCDMSFQYDFFLKYLKPKSKILDLGFGSARDLIYFKNNGHSVIGIDPTDAFIDNAKRLGLEVYKQAAQEMSFDTTFDAIWACASLLHIPSNELSNVFLKCYNALEKNGYMYASFKYGEFEGERNGRIFTDMTESKLNEYLMNIPFKIIETSITGDVREDRQNELWLNVILKK